MLDADFSKFYWLGSVIINVGGVGVVFFFEKKKLGLFCDFFVTDL